MARATKRNNLTDAASLAAVNPENTRLIADFIEYLRSTQKSETTISVYKNDLDIAMVWALHYNRNKFFVEWTKRDIMSFQGWLINENGNSPARVRRIKATLSSLSNFIESILDDDYPNFRNIIHKVESPVSHPVREKTVLSDDQIKSLLSELTKRGEYQKACMLALGAYSGRRKSELVRFKVCYFDESNIVYGSLIKTPEKIKTKGRGNGKYLNCFVLEHDFRPYFDMWMDERKRVGIESEWLFPMPGDPSKPLSPTTLNSWAQTFSRILGIDFYWHALRHSFTTGLIRAGLPESVITSIVGWESTDMVKVYNDVPIDEQIGAFFDENGIKATSPATVQSL